jgi:hypothetical protein
VIRLAVVGLVARRLQSLIVLIGLAVTLISFVGLSAGVQSTTAQLTGDLGQAWDTPFDLLIRPAGSAEQLELRDGLVRPNYVSGIHGGITVAELEDIRDVPGVSVAAPLATVGAVNWPSAYQVPLASHATAPGGDGPSVFRVTSAITGQAGLSTYPVETRYIVVAPTGELNFQSGALTIPGASAPIRCGYPVNCFAGTVCFDGECIAGRYPSVEDANYYLPLLQPIQVAGIDPIAEDQLTALGACMTSGRLLGSDDAPSPTEDPEPAELLPVIASDTLFLDQVLDVDVATAPLGSALGVAQITDWTNLGDRQVSLQELYREYLDTSVHDYLDPWPIWTAGEVRYADVGPDHLRAEPVSPDLEIYDRVNTFQEVGLQDSVLIPPETADPWLRPVTEHADPEPPGVGSSYRSKIWDVTGHYDPGCLSGFDPLAGASMEAYSAPDVRTPDGELITPSRTLSDYVASPPMLLTTLAGAAWLADPDHYAGQPGDAFISVIRVRVAGTEEPGAESQSRLKAVAAAIQERTGLQVDIVKGASTRTIGVDLPAGTFGRPALTVSEQWSVKGVAVTFLRAVSAQDGALLALLLVAAGLLVGQGSYIAVRQRRFELARLRALGWSPLRLAGLIEVESLVLGLGAGLLALIVALPLAARLGVPLTVAAVTPAAGAVVAALAALPAAWASSRGTALSAMNDLHPVRDERPTSTTFGLAVRELRRSWAVETLLGIVAVAIGVTLVGLVALVSAAFSAQLDTTVLGTALSTEIRPFHVVLAIVTLVLGTAAVAQVTLSAWLGRRRQLGMLKALGWSGGRIAGLVWWQALILGAGGGLIAVLVVIASGLLLGAAPGSLTAAAATAAAAAVAATIAAGSAPGLMAVTTPARELLA